MAIWKEQTTANKESAPISPVRPSPTQSELRPDLDPSYDSPRRPMAEDNTKESVIAAGLTIEFVPQSDTTFVMLSDLGALDEQPVEFRAQADGSVAFLLQGQPLGVKK